MTREDRADGTATVFTLTGCDSANADCGFAGSRSKVEIELRGTSNAIRTDTQQFDQFDRPRRTLQQLLGGSYSEVSRTYDVFGRLAAESFPRGLSDPARYTTYTYDLIGRATRIRRPVSAADSSDHDTTFDYQGLSVEQVDALNRKTKQRRNAIGLTVQTFDATPFANNYTTDTDYEYDAFGNLLKTRDALGNEAVLTYNVRGMKKTSSDPDMGSWSYEYFPLGELKSQTDAKSQTVSFTYDALSRPRFRTGETEGVTEWSWGNSVSEHNVGALHSISAPGYSETYSYDGMARPIKRRIVIGPNTHDYDFDYSPTTGLLDELIYPTSTSGFRLTLEYVYDHGVLSKVKDGSTTYWQADTMNALGQVTQATLGNGVVTTRQFDAVTGQVSNIQSGLGGGAALQNESYLFDEVGNLMQRQRQTIALALTEDFHFDVMDRLEYSELNGTENLRLTYDALGNIKSRSDIAGGATWSYHASKKHALIQAGPYSYEYDANGNAKKRHGFDIAWNTANYPTVINGPGKSLTFSYGPDRQRYRQVYVNGGTTETTTYIGGALEKVEAGGVIDFRHYIHADGAAVALLSRKDNGTNATRYLLQDHLGSVASILDATGTLLVTESFGAFGERRDAEDWDGGCNCPTLAQIASLTRHGFTGHEMIGGASMGLIHMNGRVMDSLIGRFLSADPMVQAPYFSQSLNRYSYVFNNPLSFTDPSGFQAGEPDVTPRPRPSPWPEYVPGCGMPRWVSCEPFDNGAINDAGPSPVGSPKPVTIAQPGPAVLSALGVLYSQAPTSGPPDVMPHGAYGDYLLELLRVHSGWNWWHRERFRYLGCDVICQSRLGNEAFLLDILEAEEAGLIRDEIVTNGDIVTTSATVAPALGPAMRVATAGRPIIGGIFARATVATAEGTVAARAALNPKIYAQLEKQLADPRAGAQSIHTALRSAEQTLAEHKVALETYRAAGGYTSKVETTIRNVESQIETLKQFILDKGL